ncbi:hypothetical protein YC2023_045538 [Brassica napus]
MRHINWIKTNKQKYRTFVSNQDVIVNEMDKYKLNSKKGNHLVMVAKLQENGQLHISLTIQLNNMKQLITKTYLSPNIVTFLMNISPIISKSEPERRIHSQSEIST